MIQLSSPTRVTPASLRRAGVEGAELADGVAVADVQRVGSPRYFMSCGARRCGMNWKMRLSRPMVVRPSITQCGPTVVPAPMRTSAPITA
jgi:hypothetical protein